MPDLEQSILAWREQMQAGGIKSDEVLDELETHLRDDIQGRVRAGMSAEEAFECAAREMGTAKILRKEFSKAGETLFERLTRFVLASAGIPNMQLATNMNTSTPNSESPFATYFKAVAFALPAILFWLFSAFFVLPKVTEMCQRTGTTVFHFEQAPAIFRGLSYVGRLMVELTHNGLLVLVVVGAVIGLLEWRSAKWPRYRRAAFGISAFFLNTLVLVAITMMVVSAVVAAQGLMYPGR